jgi:hypothetical protein
MTLSPVGAAGGRVRAAASERLEIHDLAAEQIEERLDRRLL